MNVGRALVALDEQTPLAPNPYIALRSPIAEPSGAGVGKMGLIVGVTCWLVL